MLAIGLALMSSVLWGFSDYFGGVKSRSFPVPVVLAGRTARRWRSCSSSSRRAARGRRTRSTCSPGSAAGLVGIVGLSAFYRGLAIGTMSIVAPIAATGVSVPVIAGLILGDEPGLAGSLGLALAVVGIVLASREDDESTIGPREQRRSIVLAIVAGLGFGTYFVLAGIGSDADVAWTLLLSRVSGFPIVALVALLVLRRGERGSAPGRSALAALAGIGLLDLGANALFNVASTMGELSSVAVASSLYPVVTVMMAALLLGERVQGVQRVGVFVALTGVVLIAAGA